MWTSQHGLTNNKLCLIMSSAFMSSIRIVGLKSPPHYKTPLRSNNKRKKMRIAVNNNLNLKIPGIWLNNTFISLIELPWLEFSCPIRLLVVKDSSTAKYLWIPNHKISQTKSLNKLRKTNCYQKQNSKELLMHQR